ncbi:restriction endonuclease subunit S [Clostridium sp. OM08-29]|nr:restriction endonuclease subunit S [Clostridium sp. OM08-29]
MVKELKHTEIGDIPVDWELQTFDETFRVISNNTLSRENLNNRGGAVRNIHYGDILTKFPEVLDCNEEEIPYVNELSLLSSSTQLLQDGDIVVADTAEDETVGKVIEVQNLGDSKLVAGLHTIPCRVKKGDFAPGWLGYYMNSDLFHNQILPYITGIKVSSISKGAISETLILVPPFDEQEKIVQSLNKIQLLMTSETKVVNKIKLVKNGCLSKMFPQKDDTVPEMRLPGFTEAWEQRKLGELGSLKNGMNFSKDAMGHGYAFVNLQNIFGHNVVNIDDLGLAEASEKQLIEYSLQKGDVLFVRSSVKLEGVGEAALVPRNLENTTYSGFIIRFRDEHGLNDDFKKFIFLTQKVRDQIMSQATNSANKNISQSVLENLSFEVPVYEEQQKIGEYFSNLDNLITLHQCKCDKYSNIKKGMMSDLLTGKIRLV